MRTARAAATHPAEATDLMASPRNKRRTGPNEEGVRLGFVLRRPVVARVLLAVTTGAAVAAFMVDWTPRAGTAGLGLGDIAPKDIRAGHQLEIVDEELTADKKALARRSTPPLFEHDVLLSRTMLQHVDKAFTDMRTFLASQPAPPPVEPGDPDDDGTDPSEDDDPAEGSEAVAEEPPAGPDPIAMEQQQESFQDELGVQLSEIDLANLQASGWAASTQRDIKELVRVAMSDYIVLELDRLPASGSVTVQRIEGSSRTEFTLDDFRSIVDLRQAKDTITRTAQADFSDRPPHQLASIVTIARALAVPNLRFNASETEVRREHAVAAVAPVTTTYQRGQVILRSGEPVTPWDLRVIERMNAEAVGYIPAVHMVALTLLLALLVGLFARFSERFLPGFRRRYNDLLAMAALLLFVVGLSALLRELGGGGMSAGSLPATAFQYLVPVAVGGVLLRTLMNAVTAAAWGVLAGVCCAAVMDGGLLLAVFYVVSTLAAVAGLGKAHERGRLIRAGLVAALANVAVVVAMDFVGLSSTTGPGLFGGDLTTPLVHIVFALLGGVMSGVLAVGLAPMFETLGFVTDSKLLELSNLNHPLMREMIVKAPGTYHHSMVVGSLAEAAADAIGANSLLVRVGAYFHDIGKALKPQYFIENQRDVENIHDRLSPSMSALVIVSHVKEGIELARKHKLPEPLIDMIPQHHGTSLVGFFYNKAVQQADPGKGEINDSDYRYPGPKPQTKEAAIMMLADGVEAATRSLKTHSQGAISARVQKILNKCVADGQLDECPLTLRDLHTASETFVQVLMGIHHHRIEYPAPPGAKQTRARGLPASSITLEIPPMTPNPDDAGALVPGPREPVGLPTGTVDITDTPDKPPAANTTDGG